MRKLAIAGMVILTAILVATFASADSVGIGIKKTAPISGTGSSGSPLKIDVCLSGSGYVSNGTSWACGSVGGITNSAGVNVVMKSNGTNAVASSITDTGTQITTTMPLTVGGTFIASGSLSTFGNGNPYSYFENNTLNFDRNNSAASTGYINYYGYVSDVTAFRNLVISDGKAAAILTFTGSSKLAAFAGSVTSAGTLAVTGLSTLTGGVTTPANLTTTSSGDVVSARHVTAVNDMTAGGALTSGGNATFGDADTDTTNIAGRLGFSGANPSISACGTSPSITGEAQSFQLTVGTGITACVVTLGKTFTAAPYCTFSAANAAAANKIASLTGTNGGDEPYMTSSTTTATMNFIANTEGSAIYNVLCPDRF